MNDIKWVHIRAEKISTYQFLLRFPSFLIGTKRILKGSNLVSKCVQLGNPT